MTRLYRGMDRAALDAAYNNVAAAPDFAGILADFQARSARLYESAVCRRDLSYGARPRQRYDWFSCGQAGAPTFVFIHGGYWQHCEKEDFAFVASGPLGRGFNVALAEYTLAPQASLTDIVAEIGGLLDHLAVDPDGVGSRGKPLCLSGHSAGGHLTAMHRAHPAVAWGLAISALVDLEPIRLCWLNEKLRLSEAEARACSPLLHIGPGAPAVAAVGAAELPELVRQTEDYVRACEAAGEPVRGLQVPGCAHFSLLDDLARPDGVMLEALAATMRAGRGG